MKSLIEINSSPVVDFLDLLLQDKSTKQNIIWATDSYELLGDGFSDEDQITRDRLLINPSLIRPRIQKTIEAQQERTRKKAEVYTPAWLCNKMNNDCDETWFGRKDVFNVETTEHTWNVIDENIEFPKGKTWKGYVDSRRLEIACGEAPYLVSRYDASTGETIYPLKRRIGQLDRKLRVIDENVPYYDEWVKWVVRAFESSYGFEYQGDSLLIARINLLMTFFEYYQNRWNKVPDSTLLRLIVNKIAWNLWQMDGIKDTVPLGKPHTEYEQLSLFEMEPTLILSAEERNAIPCKVYDWRQKQSVLFRSLKER